jgi:hypothetical protein
MSNVKKTGINEYCLTCSILKEMTKNKITASHK